MSRTYRRRRYRQLFSSSDPLMDWFVAEDQIIWEDVDSVKISCDFGWNEHYHFNVKYRADSKTGRKLLSIAASDAATNSCKEPGPHHFRNLYSDRPLRRQAKEELRKYMYNEEHEVMIISMPPLPYYT